MDQDLCPQCGDLRDMNISSHYILNRGEDGTLKTTLTKVYHCETCAAFVRCEEADGPEFGIIHSILKRQQTGIVTF